MLAGVIVLAAGYLLGSFPAALVASRAVAGVDIRQVGDGNMGALNAARTLGVGLGIVVVVVDFTKGTLAVLLAQAWGLAPEWWFAAGAAAVLGHDFPVWAGFRGGQGMAAALGALAVLMPPQTYWGIVAFAGGYLAFRNFDLSAGIGLGLIVLLAWWTPLPTSQVVYAALLFASIGLKKWLDLPRRAVIINGPGRIARAAGARHR